MNTIQLPLSVENNKQLFLQWAYLWHGNHDSTHEHDDCPVYLSLNKPTVKLTEVFEAVVETEGDDWKESWETFLNS